MNLQQMMKMLMVFKFFNYIFIFFFDLNNVNKKIDNKIQFI